MWSGTENSHIFIHCLGTRQSTMVNVNEVFPQAPFSTASTTSSYTLTMCNNNIWSEMFLTKEDLECCIDHFLHKQKKFKSLMSFQPHDTHTHCLILCMHIHMHANRPTLMTAPADTYMKNAASTLLILCGETLSQHLSESMRFMQCH